MARGPSARGFTLMELLVVLVILVVAMSIVVPMIFALQLTRVQAGEQTVSVAADAARRYAGRSIKFEKDLDPSTPGIQAGKYTGTGMIFTPSNEIRMIEAYQSAADGSTALALMTPEPRYGYRDVRNHDYIHMPRGSGVVGVLRDGANDSGLKLIAPPFAIRFDEHGYLVAAHNIPSRMVYYDGNYDGNYDISSTRLNNYNPAPYDPDHLDYNDSNFIETNSEGVQNRHELPFEQIEAVLGVLVFDKDEFYDSFSGNNPLTLAAGGDGFINGDARDWLLANGKMLFINRHTGRVIRNN